MNFEPIPLPEPPSLFDVDTVAAGGAVPIAPETADVELDWMPWGLLWPIHELVLDEALPELCVAEAAATEAAVTEAGVVQAGPPAAVEDVPVAPFPDDLPLPSEIAEIAPSAAAAASPAVRSSRLRSAALLLLVVVSLAALLAAVVGVIVAAIVLALQSALG